MVPVVHARNSRQDPAQRSSTDLFWCGLVRTRTRSPEFSVLLGLLVVAAIVVAAIVLIIRVVIRHRRGVRLAAIVA
jgi:hypothetical protein